MDETRRVHEVDAREYLSDRRCWVVSDCDDCGHPGGELTHVGSDGRNEYYRCARCEAVIVAAPS